MECQFVNVYEVSISDGYTSQPVAYFSSIMQAEMFLSSQVDKGYMRISDQVWSAIQLSDGRVFLLGKQIDLNHTELRKKEALIKSAQQKLSPEELVALLSK